MYQCLLMLTTLAILKIYGVDYRFIIFVITKNEAVHMLQILKNLLLTKQNKKIKEFSWNNYVSINGNVIAKKQE